MKYEKSGFTNEKDLKEALAFIEFQHTHKFKYK